MRTPYPPDAVLPRLLLIACALPVLLGLAACGAVVSQPTPLQCNAALWNYVYAPSRLKVVDTCRIVTGVVRDEHQNEDGDVDIRVIPDPGYESVLNDANRTKLDGALQVEAVCQAPIKASATASESACGDYHGTVVVPPPGAHVEVVGSYVLDTNHGWMEIHPVSTINILTK